MNIGGLNAIRILNLYFATNKVGFQIRIKTEIHNNHTMVKISYSMNLYRVNKVSGT